MPGGVRVSFHGVRGSTPCAGEQYARYGGHSSCVTLEADGEPPIVLDLGTGLRPFGERWRGPFHGSVLLTHLHWDHVQGLPFFRPLHDAGATLDVYGPRQAEGPLGDVFAQLMRPPFFPIDPSGLPGALRFHDAGDDDFALGTAKVRSRWVPHVGPTLGFRVEWHGVSIAYLPDHGPGCQEGRSAEHVAQEVLELCDGVDLLIHDAQFTRDEYDARPHWGHASVDYAMHVARVAGAQRLALFHHDPSHSDDVLDGLHARAQDDASRLGLGQVFAAHEGCEMSCRSPMQMSR